MTLTATKVQNLSERIHGRIWKDIFIEVGMIFQQRFTTNLLPLSKPKFNNLKDKQSR